MRAQAPRFGSSMRATSDSTDSYGVMPRVYAGEMWSKLAIGTLVVACGGGNTPKESIPPAPRPVPADAAAAPAPVACLKRDAIIELVRVVGDVVVACYQDAGGCWSLDPATGAGQPHGGLPEIISHEPEVTVDAAGIKVCAAGATDCKAIATKDFPDGGLAVAKSDRSLVAVATTKAVTVYDVAKGTKLARIPGWKTPMTDGSTVFQFPRMQFLGDNLAVWESYSPVSSAAKLFAPRTGKLVADLAGPNIEISDGDPAQLDGASWAFVGFEYNHVYVQDVATGKVVATYDLGKVDTGQPNAWIGRIGDVFVVAADTVRAIDTRSKAVKVLEPPRCR